jgi:hypothetical protein
MEIASLSRRSLLQAIAAIIASTATPLGWTEVAHAMDAHSAQLPRADDKLAFFSASDASDVEAVAAQIIPTDGSPGAREAGAVYFIDRARCSFFSQLGGDYRSQLSTCQQVRLGHSKDWMICHRG